MLFKEFCEKTDTYHFKVKVLGTDDVFMADYIPYKYDDYEVKLIECDLEIGKQSPITHSLDIRPILVVLIKEIKDDTQRMVR